MKRVFLVGLTIIVVLASLARTPPVRADGSYLNHFYSGVILQTCSLMCDISSEYGTEAEIWIGPENFTARSSLVQWVSFDNWDLGHHQWIQAGYAIGTLPDLTVATTPIFYGEHQTATDYTFYNFGPAEFNAWHTFKVWQDRSNEYISIDGVVKETFTNTFSSGQSAAQLETLEWSDMPSLSTANGHWRNLQFYSTANNQWSIFGSNDPNGLVFRFPTSNQFFGTWWCFGGYVPDVISKSDFSTSFVNYGSKGPCGGGSPLVHKMSPVSDNRFFGPGPQGGAPRGTSDSPLQLFLNPVVVLSLGLAVFATGLVLFIKHRRKYR